jgi:hypothetical protein
MATNHDAVAALPISGLPSKTLLRNVLVARMPYVLADADDVTNLVAVDPDTGAAIIDIVFSAGCSTYDDTDTTTANDGISCLVTSTAALQAQRRLGRICLFGARQHALATPPSRRRSATPI